MTNNVFRKEHRDLTDQEKGALDAIKVKASELWDLMDEQRLVKVNKEQKGLADNIADGQKRLEESVMWTVKGITG